jgi:glycosyltransferase involved in cell wall biosynthesis
MPLISVIVPIHRAEQYLDRCLRSIVAQTLEDIEIICVDDRSPDQSARIVETFSATDSRVRLIRNERNLGPGGARNTGIRMARAPYVAGVDSDDYIHPAMMETLWTAAAGQNADVVECGFEQVAEDGTVLGRYSPPARQLDNSEHRIDVFAELKSAFWNKLWRRSLFAENGIEFPNRLNFDDLATTPRLLAYARDIRTIPDALYCYVTRPGSISTSWSPKHMMDYFECFDLLADFLRERGLEERYLPALLGCIGPNLHYHATQVLESGMNRKDKERYVRHLLMLKLGYIRHRERLRDMSAKELLLALRDEN